MDRLTDLIDENNINLKFIFEFFEDYYVEAYKELKGPGKSKLYKYSAVTFKKWYYSVLINETVLSPANIFCSRFADQKNHTLKAVHIKPISSGYFLKGFDFFVNTYSKDEHPIINDLKTLVEFFDPMLNLTEHSLIEPSMTVKILDKLSIYDPFYVDYLTLIAFRLKLIKKLPALYVLQAQLAPDYNDFFKLQTKQQLEKIINISISISAKYLSGILPISNSILNESFILSLLKCPLNTDEIFTKIYSSLGFDMNHVWEIFENPPDVLADEMEGALISSTYFLGVLLDQWFFTIFGYYLKLIQPLYFFPMNLKNELTFAFEDILEDSEMPPSLFAPCTFYGLTTLGNLFFNDGKAREDDINMIPNDININDLCEAIIFEVATSFSENNFMEDMEYEKPEGDIYVMKMKQMLDKRYWKTIEITDTITLHDFHRTIASCFGFDSECLYSFFLNGAHAFSEYTAPYTKNKKKKADKVCLNELNFAEKQKFTYKAKLNGDFNIEIELLKIKKAMSGVYYPRIVKRSKLMAEDEDKFIF